MTSSNCIWRLLTDPNVSFLLLVLGLWCVVLAVSLPGTGLPDVTAILSLTLAAIGLFTLPVNLVGLLLIALALVLFIAEFQVAVARRAAAGAAPWRWAWARLCRFIAARTPAGGTLSWVTLVAAPLVSTLLFGC